MSRISGSQPASTASVAASRPILTLNIAPVRVPETTLKVGVFDYGDAGREKLHALRDAHNGTHVFLRDNESILSIAVVADAPFLGDREETVQLPERLRIAATLVRNGLFNYLRQLGRQVFEHLPLTFAAQSNLLAGLLPAGLSCPEWLSLRPLHLLDVRVFHFDHREPFIGVALDIRTSRGITCSCAELLKLGIPLDGCYVGKLTTHADSRLEPYLRLLGRVALVEGGVLHLDDTRVGDTVRAIAASDAHLEARREHFGRCLEHLYGQRATQIKELLDDATAALRMGPRRLERLRATAQYLARTPLPILPGVAVRLESLLTSQTSEEFPPLETPPRPVYVFDATGSRTSTWHDGGIKQYGPYSAQTFDKNRPRVCIVCQATRKGQVEQLLHKFLNGVSNLRKPAHSQPFQNGFIRKYALEGVDPEFFPVNGDTVAEYQRAVQQAIARQTESSFKWDLAFVQVEDRFRDLPPTQNPYLQTKVDFLTHQIPVQEFRIETAQLPDGQLSYALNNMALATYAKLGGIPWLLRSDRTIAHELVVGIGSAYIGEGRLGERQRVVGITTVFTGDGNYWLSNLTRSVPMAEYESALLEALRGAITRIRQDMNWQSRDHIRLVFHAFKPFKNTEAAAVKALVAELGDYDVDYAFIHVEESHPYLLFDEQQAGVTDYETRSVKGQFVPDRGRFLRLSQRDVLMFLTGPKDIKRPTDGMPHPVLMKLHPESTFKDTTYLARQMNAFASHSWRSFFPASLPVTILYSELIAKLLGLLSMVPKWNPDTVMAGRIGRTRWFL